MYKKRVFLEYFKNKGCCMIKVGMYKFYVFIYRFIYLFVCVFYMCGWLYVMYGVLEEDIIGIGLFEVRIGIDISELNLDFL